jgi:hypothetical protein
MTKCTVEFNFDNNQGTLDDKICQLLSVPRNTKTIELTNEQYNKLCVVYNVPNFDEEIVLDIESTEDDSIVCSRLSDRFGWLVERIDYE